GHMGKKGPHAQIAKLPRIELMASMVELYLYRGTETTGSIVLATGGRLVAAEQCEGGVFAASPPNTVSLHRERPEGSPRNTWRVRVDSLEQHGSTTRVHAHGAPDVLADITPAAVAALELTVGTRVWAELKATEIRTYPA